MNNKSTFLLPALLALATVAAPFLGRAAAPPAVANVTAAQRAGTKLVDIRYDLIYAGTQAVSISILVSSNSGAVFDVPAATFGGDYGDGIRPGTGKWAVWNAGADWNGQFSTTCRARVLAGEGPGAVYIRAGSYTRGNSIGDTDITDAPPFSVNVSGFFIEPYLVTGAQWRSVIGPGQIAGYTFDNAGSSVADSHPVQTINWFDAAKWCNARSQQEGRVPVYYTDAGYTVVYRTGQAAPYVKPGVNGWRLPTEAEWEKAARGGLSGKRFPWGDTITHSQANYYSSSSYSYDISPTRGNHPTYSTGPFPYTSPVGSFPANGNGLFDMAGNVWEWCFDWHGSAYYASGQIDPQGASSGPARVLRGGSWSGPAFFARCARRDYNSPTSAGSSIGFRCVRGL